MRQRAIIVPGHGDMMTDTAYLDLPAETMGLVVKEADPRVAEGRSPDEIGAAVWFETPIVEAEYNEATGKGNESLEEPEG